MCSKNNVQRIIQFSNITNFNRIYMTREAFNDKSMLSLMDQLVKIGVHLLTKSLAPHTERKGVEVEVKDFAKTEEG